MARVKEIVNYLLNKYPLYLASSFDQNKVGLQFGNPDKEVSKVLIALDGSKDVIKEAIDNNCNMIITHHPFMFNPMINMNYTLPFGKKMLMVFQNELNVFSMHTNFDVSVDGMNELLAKKIGLKDVHALTEEIDKDSFLRIGTVDKISLGGYATFVKDALGESAVRVVGNLDKPIQRVSVCGGSGSSFLFDALRANCDVIVTGEIRHNNAIDAIENNIGIIEVSHSVEKIFMEHIQSLLVTEFKEVDFIVSKIDQNPFKVL